jgi:hypothetical protein
MGVGCVEQPAYSGGEWQWWCVGCGDGCDCLGDAECMAATKLLDPAFLMLPRHMFWGE